MIRLKWKTLARLTAFACLFAAPIALGQAATESTPQPPVAEPAPAEAPADSADVGGTPEPGVRESPWRVELYAWGWLTAMTGTVGVRRLSADIDASVADIIDASDSLFVIAGRLEVGYGKFGAYVDGFYGDIGMDDQSGPPGFADVDVTTQEAIVDFGLMYRFGDWKPSGDAAKNRRNMTLDLYGGGRYSSLDVSIDPARINARSREEDWLDPIIGARFILPIAEQWNLSVNGDIGGFGVASDITWSTTAVAGFDFHIFKLPATAYLGYRAIGWDYSTGSGSDRFEWDIIQHGPLLGLSIQF